MIFLSQIDCLMLTYMLPHLHHGGFVTCEPCDVPVSKRHLDMLYTHMRWSDKPHLGAITEMSRAQDSVDMARILHGPDTLQQHCVIMGNVNTNSPLLVDKVVTEAIRVYCSAGQGIVVVPFILGGAMGGKILDRAGIENVSKMPSREELLASIAGCIGAVSSNLAGAIGASGSDLAGILSRIEEKAAA